MRLAIVTGVWGRPDIFKMFAEGVVDLQKKFAGRLEIVCCVVGSEGHRSADIVNAYPNFFYTEFPNRPLGEKMNRATYLAKRLGVDYCLMVGSDDIVGVALMEKYFVAMQNGIDYTYLTDLYFFDTVSKRGLYWGGYLTRARGMGAGTGRLISARLLTKFGWVCWPPGYDRILDTGFELQLKRHNHSKMEINLKRDGLFALDIKSPNNMTPFEQWENSEFTDGHELLFNNLPNHLAETIYGTRSKS